MLEAVDEIIARVSRDHSDERRDAPETGFDAHGVDVLLKFQAQVRLDFCFHTAVRSHSLTCVTAPAIEAARSGPARMRLAASFSSSTRNGLARKGSWRDLRNSTVCGPSVSPVIKRMRSRAGLCVRTSTS